MKYKTKILNQIVIGVMISLSISFLTAQSLRLSLFNIKELSTAKITDVDEDGIGQNQQLIAAAKIIQNISPDVLVINEIDHDYSHSENLQLNAKRFLSSYLKSGDTPIDYEYIFTAPCNTGLLTGFDLNNDGHNATKKDQGTRKHGDDCYGWGQYPGQYSMAVLSKFPFQGKGVKTFQNFLWKDLPGNHIPSKFYSKEELQLFRLSSKSHWDLPLSVNGKQLHLLLSHPTPPVFDGLEDRNGRRNHDEIKFWKLYISGSKEIYDDTNSISVFDQETSFVIMGDLNAAIQGNKDYDDTNAIDQLLNHPRITDSGPFMISNGAKYGIKPGTPNFYEQATTEFRSGMKRRIDYILPSNDINIKDGGVFWPASTTNPQQNALAMKASDHRMIWLDIDLE